MEKQRGEITAFLSLIFILLVSFILSMTESVFIQTAKNQSRLDVDKAVFSVFGEYQKELLEEYDIFAIDSSYGSGEFDSARILSRLAYYGDTNIQHEITDLQFLTDNQGQAFREAAAAYMESKTGIETLQDVTGWTQKWEEQTVSGESISNSLNQSLQENSNLLPEEAKSLTDKTASGNFLSLVLPKEFQLSKKAITVSEQVSQRQKNTGWGTFPMRQGMNGIDDSMLFQQYLIEKFNSAVDQKSENRSLNYEIEYLICGNASDEENLKEIITKLILFRLSMNYLYLQTDAGRQQEAAAWAAAIAVLLAMPEAEPVICQLLLVLWAFGESVLDLRSLLKGKKAAFYKNDESWQLTLGSLFTLGSSTDAIEGKDADQGLDYTQYLQILLYIKSTEELTMRALDRIEQNLNTEKGLEKFRADLCVTKMKLLSTAEAGAGYQYQFPVFYGYL